MPFKSEKQKRFMYANHPDIAKRWQDEGEAYIEHPDKIKRMAHHMKKKMMEKKHKRERD